jgi:hypothetical protein
MTLGNMRELGHGIFASSFEAGKRDMARKAVLSADLAG